MPTSLQLTHQNGIVVKVSMDKVGRRLDKKAQLEGYAMKNARGDPDREHIRKHSAEPSCMTGSCKDKGR